ncbi:SIR2 family protein [Terriglobus albidus]|uniref:SIR2 family protein n=1 Tax=Terriglobus albidus TaxID=1592106 RepID=UPI0021DFAFE1|nr:SIR2 family protein [Terriglobus albidus]
MRRASPGTSLLEGLEPLIEAVQQKRLILFVGGGASQNLGLPDFTALVKHLAQELGTEQPALAYPDYPIIAEAYLLKHGKLGPLRSWMDLTWHPNSVSIADSELHRLIVEIGFSTIYTTNYDRWLERAFEQYKKPFHKIANVADLTQHAAGATEIIKFHGDFEDDESLVLTESSYFQRMLFESPLDLRLRSDSLARPILFIGYSLHDINTRYLLFRLQELWRNSVYGNQRPLSYIVMNQHDLPQEAVLRSRGVIPIVLENLDAGEAVTRLLRELSNSVSKAKPKKTSSS